MYLIQRHHGNQAKTMAVKSPPVGAGVDDEIADKVDCLELWGSSFHDPGPDYCEIRLFSKNNLIKTVRVKGY